MNVRRHFPETIRSAATSGTGKSRWIMRLRFSAGAGLALGFTCNRCRHPVATLQVSPSKVGEIQPSASMNVARAGHTATLLKDGTVLIAGGMLRNGDFTATAETYDPKTDRFTPTKDMLIGIPRVESWRLPPHCCQAGRVLIVGGWKITDDAELHDPAARLVRYNAGSSYDPEASSPDRDAAPTMARC